MNILRMNILRYIRVSGKGQIDKEGPDRQRDVIAAFCSRYGLHCAGEYFDAGVSGTIDTLERPEFMSMIKDILKRRAVSEEIGAGKHEMRVDAVVVEKADRLARTLAVQEASVIQLRKHGIKLFLAEQGTLTDYAADSGDPSLNMFRQMLGVIAEFEKANMCHRLKHARGALWKKNGRCEGRKPYGTHPGEKEVLDLIKIYLSQTFTPTEVAFELNAAGHRTRCGLQWTAQHVQDVRRSGSRRSRHFVVPPHVLVSEG